MLRPQYEQLLIVARTYRLALTAIGKDEALPCRCGTDPYTDGEECPKCTALSVLKIPIEPKPLTKRQIRAITKANAQR